MMYSCLSKNKKELILVAVSLLWCFLEHAFENNYIVFGGDFKMRFSDADDYMILTKLRDFFVHGDLTYSLVHRVNVPFGVDIYWSRLYDFFLIISVWFVDLFVNSISKSIEYAGFCIAPIIKSVLCVVMYNFFQKFMPKSNAFFGAALFSLLPDLGEITEFGRPDHHIFIMALEVAYLYSLVNILKNECKLKTDYIKSGIAASLCIWGAIETLPMILLAEAVLFFFFRNDGEKLDFLYLKTITTTCAIGAIVFLSFPLTLNYVVGFIALSASSIIVVRKIDDWRRSILWALLILAFFKDDAFAYDKISLTHLELYLFASLYFAANRLYLKRAAQSSLRFAVAIGLALGVIFLYKYPKFLLGVEGGASDFLRNIWFPKIQDLSSPLEFHFGDSFCFCLRGIVLFAAIYDKVCCLTNKKYENLDVFWWILIVLNSVYFFFAVNVRRLIPTLAMMDLPLIMSLGLNGIAVNLLSRKVKILITCGLALIPAATQKYIGMARGVLFHRAKFTESIRKAQNDMRREDEVYKFLDGLSDVPVVIMADPYSGPRILYHTKHKVVAVPFHSQEKGIISSLTITIKPRATEEETKEILKSTDSSYVFIKKSMCVCPESAYNLANDMKRGDIPTWLELVELPIESHEHIIAKTRKNEL